jgi:hypothetical protein
MTNDQEPTLEEMWPLPPGIKLRRPQFGSSPESAPVTVRGSENTADATLNSERFEIRWKDPEQGFAVAMREQPDGRLIAEVSGVGNSLLGKWVSVSLAGMVNDHLISKTIALKAPEQNGCNASADFGLLTDVARELGPQIRMIVFLLL